MATAAQLNSIYKQYLGRNAEKSALTGDYSRMSEASVRADVSKSKEALSRSSKPKASQSQQLTNFANQQRAESNALLTRQNKEQEKLFGNYESIRKKQEALPALYNRLQNEAGIPGLSEAAQGFKNEMYKVKDRLDRLGEDITSRTSGTLTTEAQRNRLQTAEADPLQTNLSRLGTGLAPVADMLSSANQSVSTQMGLQTDQQERELEPVKLRINAISDKFAREITGFTSNRELQLTAVLDKLKRERELSDREWQLAQTLAAEERSFARQKSLAASSISIGGGGSSGGGGGTAPAPTATTYRSLPSLPATVKSKSAPAPKPKPKPYSPPSYSFNLPQFPSNNWATGGR